MDECRCGCARPAGSRYGLRWVCYKRWLAAGRPAAPPPPRAPAAARAEDYRELRAWGLTAPQAAERLGVTLRTVQRYEQSLKAGQPC